MCTGGEIKSPYRTFYKQFFAVQIVCIITRGERYVRRTRIWVREINRSERTRARARLSKAGQGRRERLENIVNNRVENIIYTCTGRARTSHEHDRGISKSNVKRYDIRSFSR